MVSQVVEATFIWILEFDSPLNKIMGAKHPLLCLEYSKGSAHVIWFWVLFSCGSVHMASVLHATSIRISQQRFVISFPAWSIDAVFGRAATQRIFSWETSVTWHSCYEEASFARTPFQSNAPRQPRPRAWPEGVAAWGTLQRWTVEFPKTEELNEIKRRTLPAIKIAPPLHS